jgi:hypothetical protein
MVGRVGNRCCFHRLHLASDARRPPTPPATANDEFDPEAAASKRGRKEGRKEGRNTSTANAGQNGSGGENDRDRESGSGQPIGQSKEGFPPLLGTSFTLELSQCVCVNRNVETHFSV